MKKGFSIWYVAVIVVLLGGFLGFVAYSQVKKSEREVKYDEYDFAKYIEGTEDNGFIADHVKGDIEKAKVIIVEYADYQCPGCSTTNPRLNKLVDEYAGDLAIIYRNFLLSYHQNGTAAASAAEAAALQGYWKEYADLLFTNQSKWEYASGSERSDLFDEYFRRASNGQGDTAKFHNDIASKEVKRKIDFDMGIAKKLDVPGTPSLYLDGERIDFSEAGTEDKFLELVRSKIDEKLGKTTTESEEQ